MSTTPITRTTRTRLHTRAAASLTALGLALGIGAGSVATASPAQAACKSSEWRATVAYARAHANTEDCAWESRSYARHGGIRELTPWFSGSSSAFASVGFSTKFEAWNEFR
jgi:hypothetical protein